MTPLFAYLLKVIAVSGILYGYYLIALRNKVLHSWNRFYLLATIGLSILLPLIDLHLVAPVNNGSKMVTALQVVAGADEFLNTAAPVSQHAWSVDAIVTGLYLLLSILTLVWLIVGLAKIYRMIRRYPRTPMRELIFLNTREAGTPFSFFRYLFWHEEIDPSSANGQKILEHELVHIREKHSHDKLFVHLTLTAFWANPFFWLIRKELALVHEFIADQQTVDDGESFAQLILSATFPEHSNLLTNAYFHSSIKRRIDMITRNKHPRYQYISRLLLIPVLFLLLFTFGVKAKDMLLNETAPNTTIDKKVTVIIDAGHGGFDPGAVNGDAKEKDINLRLAKRIKEMNSNTNLEIILTREEDKTMAVSSRKDLSEQFKADLFVSLHTDASPNQKSKGFSAFISGNNATNEKQNIRLANLLLHNLSTIYATNPSVKKREHPIYVLDKSSCPAVILQNGFITNPQDRAFITQSKNQEKVAATILRSIEDYFNENVQVANPENRLSIDTVPANKTVFNNVTPNPKVTRIFINGKEIHKGAISTFVQADKVNIETNKKGEKIISITSKDGPKEVKQVVGQPLKEVEGQMIHIDHADNKMVFVQPKDSQRVKEITVVGRPKPMSDPIYILEGKEITKEEMNMIPPDKISSINVIKDASAIQKYGPKAIGGVVEIFLKDGQKANSTASSTSKEITVVGYKLPKQQIVELNKAAMGQSKEKAKSQLILVDGNEVSEEEREKIKPENIESVYVLNEASARSAYGDKGKNGAIVIILKKTSSLY